ncbi:MAG: hypothetical protein ACOX5C_01415 [Acutalibacteraceae bacterium]|jgi:hypothetical protein
MLGIVQNGLYIGYIAAFLLIVCAAIVILNAKTEKKDGLEELNDILKKSETKYIPNNEEINITNKS